MFCIGNKQASDYEVTQELTLNYIKKTYEHGNYMSESLRTLGETDTEKWKPTLKVGVKTDEVEKKTEEPQHKLECKVELDEAMRRTKKHESNKFKAHVELWERCSKSIKSKIEARVDYESGTFNDPIKSL